MKSLTILVFLASAILLVGVAFVNHQQLPEKIATHFDAQGRPNGWSAKARFTRSTLAVGFGIPLVVLGLVYAMRFLPPKYLNVPNPAYWRVPANCRRACGFLFASSLWFASAFFLWQAAFSRLIVSANQAAPPLLEPGKVMFVTIPLLLFTVGWIVLMALRFVRTG